MGIPNRKATLKGINKKIYVILLHIVSGGAWWIFVNYCKISESELTVHNNYILFAEIHLFNVVNNEPYGLVPYSKVYTYATIKAHSLEKHEILYNSRRIVK